MWLRKEEKGKEERERYTHLNIKSERVASRDKKLNKAKKKKKKKREGKQ